MRHQILLLAFFIIALSRCNAQIRYRIGIQDYASVAELQNETIIPRLADKVFVRPNKALYYFDFSDTTTPHDGVNCIVQQPARRWKLITHIEVISASQAVGTTNNSTGNVGINIASPLYTLDVVGVDGIRIPVGTTTQRPANPNVGIIRYNTSTQKFEGYTGTQWVNLSF